MPAIRSGTETVTGEAPPVLSLRGITKRFGDLVANDAIDLTVHRGEVVALLGENGAGKTTLMNILFGRYRADAGQVLVEHDGALSKLPPASPAAALSAGIAMVHQHFTLARNLTALENIRLGTEPLFSFGKGKVRVAIQDIMDRSGLTVPLDTRVDDLPVGALQRIEILKALYARARILVLDEPTAVLTPQEAESLFDTLRHLTDAGLSVILISHKLREVLTISDRIVVLRHGSKVGEVSRADADARSLASLMVGRDVDRPKLEPRPVGDTVVELDTVSTGGANGKALQGVSLTVKAGEIVGVAGVSGNGQASLAALLSGLAAPSSGTYRYRGAANTNPTPAAAIAAGVARVPEDRNRDGIVGAMTVAENLAIEALDDPRFQSNGILNREAMQTHAAELIAAYDVRCPGPDAPARMLSGGNVQKLVLARTLGRKPKLVLASQPTRGLDVGAEAEVHRRLLEAAQSGAAVVVIAEDIDELFAIADRIVVMHDGHISDAGPAAGLDRARLGLMMAGERA